MIARSILLSWAAVVAPPAALADAPAIGERIGELSFTDTRYLPRSLGEFGEREAFVLVFTTTDCPLVQRYLPRLAAMEREYRPRSVQFLAVGVGPHDSLIEIAAQAVEKGGGIPFVKDFDGSTVEALGVERTPEVVVLDGQRRLRYRGRVDSQYRLGGVRPDEGRADLREALEAVLAGREVSVGETPVDGCRIQPTRERTGQAPPYAAVDAVLRAHCQECHRPGTEAPFSLITFDQVAAHADTIGEVVREGRMPPWYADERHGTFGNSRLLDDDERETLLAWVAAGAPDPGPQPLPPPVEWPETDWRIGEPDLVITQPKAEELPADGYVPYRYEVLPHVFTHDTWVSAVEVRPDNPGSLHHANLVHFRLGMDFDDGGFITGQVPGGSPMDLPSGTAVLIPKGSVLALQMHFVTTGVEERCQIEVGLRYPRAKVRKELKHHMIANHGFRIPPHAPAHPVAAAATFARDATGVGMFSHMHLRGRDMTFEATYPSGEREVLLSIPNYSFDWQLGYELAPDARRFPAGTRVDVLAHFDNSAFNPYNPDPSKTVRWGPQTHHEMMIGFLFFTEDEQDLGLVVDPATGRIVEASGEAGG
ncbi:MAG: redoxin family protein [Planctomycetota bacterium]|jgi:mono/diheme cytochrome c family protein|nr:redoxin family protein [Planctomycetota bacterium]MDP6988630.1 redoxin family protein [Planctomycetota bacterium]